MYVSNRASQSQYHNYENFTCVPLCLLFSLYSNSFTTDIIGEAKGKVTCTQTVKGGVGRNRFWEGKSTPIDKSDCWIWRSLQRKDKFYKRRTKVGDKITTSFRDNDFKSRYTKKERGNDEMLIYFKCWVF